MDKMGKGHCSVGVANEGPPTQLVLNLEYFVVLMFVTPSEALSVSLSSFCPFLMFPSSFDSVDREANASRTTQPTCYIRGAVAVTIVPPIPCLHRTP